MVIETAPLTTATGRVRGLCRPRAPQPVHTPFAGYSMQIFRKRITIDSPDPHVRRAPQRRPGRRARPHRIAGYADDAPLLAEQIKRLDGLFGQANDPLGRKHPRPSPVHPISGVPASVSKPERDHIVGRRITTWLKRRSHKCAARREGPYLAGPDRPTGHRRRWSSCARGPSRARF
jgi:hypothetical protein